VSLALSFSHPKALTESFLLPVPCSLEVNLEEERSI